VFLYAEIYLKYIELKKINARDARKTKVFLLFDSDLRLLRLREFFISPLTRCFKLLTRILWGALS